MNFNFTGLLLTLTASISCCVFNLTSAGLGITAAPRNGRVPRRPQGCYSPHPSWSAAVLDRGRFEALVHPWA